MLEQRQEGAVLGESVHKGRRLAAAAGTVFGLVISSRRLRGVGRGMQLQSQR